MKETLYNWCKRNTDQGDRIIREWTGIDINGNTVDINAISYGSNRKMFWKCSNNGCNNQWYTLVVNRTTSHRNCPVCADANKGKLRKVTAEKSLLQWCKKNNNDILIKEFTGIAEDNSVISIEAVSYGSKQKVFWECATCGHKWLATIKHRTLCNSGCPACKGKITTERNSLLTWCYNNSEYGKRVFNEFTGKDIDNNDIDIENVSYGSNKKMLWRCSNPKCQKEWYATVSSRTGLLSGCPICKAASTSYAEQFLYLCFKQLYPDTLNRYKIDGKTEVDIFVPSVKLCIEYSPVYWHKNKEKEDDNKKQICINKGYNYIRVVDDDYGDNINIERNYDLIVIKMIENRKDEILCKVANTLLSKYGHTISEIDINDVCSKAYSAMKVKCTPQTSIYNKYPILANEWHNKLNGNITPDIVSYGSNRKMYWICPMCNYGSNGEWYQSPNARTASGGHGCPKCRYNWAKLSANIKIIGTHEHRETI